MEGIMLIGIIFAGLVISTVWLIKQRSTLKDGELLNVLDWDDAPR